MLSVQRELSSEELAAWAGFLQTHARLSRELDIELRREHGIPLTTFEVLSQLEAAPEGRMRMSGLADAVLLSRSGLTRLVDRLARDGLLERSECPDDARGSLAVLTDKGRRRLGDALPTHCAVVRRLFLDRLDADEHRRLASTWRVLAAEG
jgi:DNA-binding MarR family transcriptional regulator